jgi:manganese oxidase
MSYNYFTVNGKAFPAVEPWIVKQGDLVRVRLVNISNLNHPMHLHGHDFKVIAKDGEPLRAEEQQVANTLSIDPGETYDIVFQANNPGLWALYCHELHHTENDGVEPGGLMQLIRYEGYQPPASAVETASPEAATPSTAMPMDAMPGHMPGMGH